MMELLTLKTVRETEKVKKHVNVYLGYITKNESKFAAVGENYNFTSDTVGENYNFTSDTDLLKSFYGVTQKKVVEQIQRRRLWH